MKVQHDEAWRQFLHAMNGRGTRIKSVREQVLRPGGRVALTLFSREDGPRPHPRLQVALPPFPDPSPPPTLYAPDPPADLAAFRLSLVDGLTAHASVLSASDLDDLPPSSPRYARHSVRTQRLGSFFGQVRARLDQWALPPEAHRITAELEAEAYAGNHQFDDADTGTYHSFQHDQPFVHYLERIHESLPEPGSEAAALLPTEQAESVRRQRDQVRSHLDVLMRQKYAHDAIIETDIERSLGGFLIDTETRQIASERAESADSLTPLYELLRVAPDASHPHAGAWVYRSAEGLHLADGSTVAVDADQIRHIPISSGRLSFRRAPGDPRLRPGIRFDWDDSGHVQQGKVGWIDWAGHCDVKAILEAVGVTLHDAESVQEWRSDTEQTTHYTRDLLLEMLASAIELGSVYRPFDGSRALVRGKHLFGGARNDSRPDRLQFSGLSKGHHFRWPLIRRADALKLVGLRLDGEVALDAAFNRWDADTDALTMTRNPRFLKVVEGDYNLIDVSGGVLTARVRIDGIDPETGLPTVRTEDLTLDLADPDADRQFLGTHVENPGEREIYRFFLDRRAAKIVGERERWARQDGHYVAIPEPEETVEIPLIAPLTVNASREARYDDPALFQTLLDTALRTGQNICADTDMHAPVWNGVVLGLNAQRTGLNRDTDIEAWNVEVRARFGTASLAYLLHRDESGQPDAFCPVRDGQQAVDFLWQDLPDVGTKGRIGTDWVVNRTMVDREIVSLHPDPSVPGGIYVYDDHIKNVYEILYAAMGGYPYTVVHGNKRWGFREEGQWKAAISAVKSLRDAVSFSP